MNSNIKHKELLYNEHIIIKELIYKWTKQQSLFYIQEPLEVSTQIFISQKHSFLKISPTIFHTFAGSDFSTSFLTLRSK